MKTMVNDLVALVGGHSGEQGEGASEDMVFQEAQEVYERIRAGNLTFSEVQSPDVSLVADSPYSRRFSVLQA